MNLCTNKCPEPRGSNKPWNECYLNVHKLQPPNNRVPRISSLYVQAVSEWGGGRYRPVRRQCGESCPEFVKVGGGGGLQYVLYTPHCSMNLCNILFKLTSMFSTTICGIAQLTIIYITGILESAEGGRLFWSRVRFQLLDATALQQFRHYTQRHGGGGGRGFRGRASLEMIESIQTGISKPSFPGEIHGVQFQRIGTGLSQLFSFVLPGGK
jgi:hypothetical protein